MVLDFLPIGTRPSAPKNEGAVNPLAASVEEKLMLPFDKKKFFVPVFSKKLMSEDATTHLKIKEVEFQINFIRTKSPNFRSF